MGERVRPGTGILSVDGVQYIGTITDYTFNSEDGFANIKEYVKRNSILTDNLTLHVKIDRIQLLRLIGLWDFALTLCPNRRVKHLMLHGSERVKYKNFRHAQRLIKRMVKEVK